MTETPKDSVRRGKSRSDGEGSVYQRHTKECLRPTDRNGRSTCKCPWQGAVVISYKGAGNTKPVRRKVSGRTRAEVAGKVTELKAMLRGNELPEISKPITLEQWLDYWFRRIAPKGRGGKPLTPYTLASYESKIRQYIVPLLGHHRLDRLTTEHIEDAWDHLLEVGNPTKAEAEPLAPNTVHQTHRILSRALKVAVQRKRLRQNPAGSDSMDAPSREDHEITPMTPNEVSQVLMAASGAYNAARWRVALALGLRQGEALGLRWEDVDLDEGVLRVQQALVRVKGQGIQFRPPKSASSRRTLAIPATLLAELRAHRKEQAEKRLAAGTFWTDSGLVFTLEDGRAIDPSVDAKRWRQLLAKAEVRHYRLHDARHSAATIMVSQGIDLRVAMKILGHSQVSVTMKYQHVVDDLIVDAAARIDDAFA